MKTLSALLFVVFLAGSLCVYIGLNGHHAKSGPSASGPVQCCTVSGDSPVLQAGLIPTPSNVMALALVIYIFFIPATPYFSFYHPPKY